MTDADAILVRVLAASDAPRLPIRRWERYVSANRLLRLADLEKLGVPFRANAGTDAARKTGERDLVALHRSGLAVVTRRAKVKFPDVKLTPKGEARARALAGLPGRDVGRLFLAAVVELGAKYAETDTGRWCPETALNDGKGWGEDATDFDRRGLALVEVDYLPAASLGWVVCGSSVHGNAAYAATPAGLTELAEPSPAPKVGKLPKEDPEAVALYRREQDGALAALAKDLPAKSGEIGDLPLVHCELLLKR